MQGPGVHVVACRSIQAPMQVYGGGGPPAVCLDGNMSACTVWLNIAINAASSGSPDPSCSWLHVCTHLPSIANTPYTLNSKCAANTF